MVLGEAVGEGSTLTMLNDYADFSGLRSLGLPPEEERFLSFSLASPPRRYQLLCPFHLRLLGKEFPQLAELAEQLMPSREIRVCGRPVMCVARLTLLLVLLNLPSNADVRKAFVLEVEVFSARGNEGEGDNSI